MLEEADLTPVERRLCAAAAAGRLLDLRTRRPGQDDPAHGHGWGADRQIRAQLVYQLLTGHGPLDQQVGRPLAVRVRGVGVVGRLNLGGLTLRYPLELYDCFIGGRVNLAKTDGIQISLRGSHLRQRFSGRDLKMKLSLNLSGGFCCLAQVDLRFGHLGGGLDATGARFTNPRGEALTADGLTVETHMSMEAAQVVGETRLSGARIAGQLNCDAASFANPDGTALAADGLVVDSHMWMVAVQASGEVELSGAHIGGQLICRAASFTNPDGIALRADGLTVDADMSLGQAQVTGEARLPGARIGALDCRDATFSHPEDMALFAAGLTVDANMLQMNTQVTGRIGLHSAHIGGVLGLNAARLVDIERSLVLDLEHAVIDRAMFLTPVALVGGIDLSHARVGRWCDHRATWPEFVRLNGFIYEHISAPNVTARQRLEWLRRQDGGYLPQPYEQLAEVYRRAGDESASRIVAIAKQRARRAQAARWWARWPSQVWSWVLRVTIGYGYRPALVLPYLAVLFAAGWMVFAHAHPDHVRPARTAADTVQPSFSAARYTLDLLLPVANLRQREAFVADGYAAWCAFGLSLAGWLLAAVVVAGLTGVFKRG
ncbi:hypothetical protein [Actinomadura sp. 6N118]|uniref:hypothetical protein n=1 Tax=Actinomadura sp. 6N118 TaxID=3375151 RepID=UPI0037BAA9C0